MEVTLPLALLGGILSFLSPCFLPIVPAFVGQLVGDTTLVDSKRARRIAALNSLGFILGFTVVFTALWATVAFLGNLVGQYGAIFRVIAGIVLILMGLHVAEIINIAPLNWMLRAPFPKPAAPSRTSTAGHPADGSPVVTQPGDSPQSVSVLEGNSPEAPLPGQTRGTGWLRSALMGIVFAAGWTPCIGPILSGILALATVAATSGQGIVLMLVYCLGLGIPILLVAVGAVEVQNHFGWFRRHHVAVSLVSGGILVVIGFLMVADLWGKVAGLLPAIG